MQQFRATRWLPAALACCVAALAQQQPAPTPPSNAIEYSREPFVIERFHTRVRFESDGTGQQELAVRTRVQNESGVQQLGQLIFGYNAAHEQLQVDSVEVLASPKMTVKVPAGAVRDRAVAIAKQAPAYTDFREKQVTVPGLQPGAILSYHVTMRIHTPVAKGQFWFEHNFIKDAMVLEELLEVDVPGDRTIKLSTEPGSRPTISEQGARRVYLWRHDNLKYDEPSDPQAQPNKPEQKKSDTSQVQLTTFQSWEEVGRWYALRQRERAEPDQTIRAKAAELVRDRTSDLERVEALYDFVAKNVRYVNLSFAPSRYEPHRAAEVLANQYGDGEDKHTLLAALVEAVGLRAYPALISTTRKLSPEIPSPAQFNHLITVVPVGKQWIWLDTTTEVAPFQLLSASLRKKTALLIPVVPEGTGEDQQARLVETPPDPPFPATQRVHVEAQVTELGKLTAHVRYTLRGDAELLLRSAFHQTPESQWNQLGRWLAASDGFGGEVSEVKTGDPRMTHESFPVEYRLTQPNYLDWSRRKSQLALPLPSLGMPSGSDDSETSKEPLDLGTPLEVVVDAALELPPKYAARLPIPVAVKRDYAEYRSNYKIEGNKVIAERSLRFRLRALPAVRRGDYVAFARAVRTDEGQPLTVESTSPGTPKVPTAAKPDELNEAGLAALASGNARSAIDLFKRVVELEPRHETAWNNLGRAYLVQGQLQDALPAFQKQIEINPNEPSVYNNLGRVLWQQHKAAEAVEAFSKQIERNPSDPGAHAYLGMLYSERHQYADAVTELETAARITPQDPQLHVALGEAYLELGKEDRALAAFDQALEIGPAPPVWNRVAYQLALKGVHLDRAQRYAESAVEATATGLRSARLDRLREEDLMRVADLALYWDTLGWVFFRRGELDRAERYVRAAWDLCQAAEIGDHLGQIYEKAAHKQQAIRSYALALARSQPLLQTQNRLTQLVGSPEKVESLRRQAESELPLLRTIKLGKLAQETASAEYFVLLSPAAGSPSGASLKAQEVRFIRGNEKLRSLAEALRAAHYPGILPEDTPTKLIRRGVLSCSDRSRECVFLLLLPGDVRSTQ